MQFDEYITNKLSERELEVAKWLIKGYSNNQIAKEINFSTYTVKYHLANTYKKLDVINRHNLSYVLGKHVKTNI